MFCYSESIFLIAALPNYFICVLTIHPILLFPGHVCPCHVAPSRLRSQNMRREVHVLSACRCPSDVHDAGRRRAESDEVAGYSGPGGQCASEESKEFWQRGVRITCKYSWRASALHRTYPLKSYYVPVPFATKTIDSSHWIHLNPPLKSLLFQVQSIPAPLISTSFQTNLWPSLYCFTVFFSENKWFSVSSDLQKHLLF